MQTMTAYRCFASVPSARRALLVCLGVTTLVALGSYFLPSDWAATGVGLTFLGATYWWSIRGRTDSEVRASGLSFGGLLETGPLDVRRLLRDGARALGWSVSAALLLFPPFVAGFVWWWQPSHPFAFSPWSTLLDDALGQLLVVALPEEAFYRGALQTRLDEACPARWRLLGGYLSPAIFVTSLLFALGHVLTEPHPSRLAVFFPSLVFGWLRTRSGGVGASVGFHAMSNLFSAYLGRSFGMWS